MLLLLTLMSVGHAKAPKWNPINPAELAELRPQVDQDAGAEIILQETVIHHGSAYDTTTEFYIRAKIYTPRGIDDFAKVEIPFGSYTDITDIAARTIKADGTIIELNPADIYTREVIKQGWEHIKVKSFAPPGIEPGVIVEYRYTVQSDAWASFIDLPFQGNFPARMVRYKYRPRSDLMPGVYQHTLYFNFAKPPAQKNDKTGYLIIEESGLMPRREEPFQPPSINTRTGVMIYYSKAGKTDPALFWKMIGGMLAMQQETDAKPTKAIQAAVARLVLPGDTDEQKLKRVFDFCRTQIKNRDRKGAFTAKERTKLKINRTATDTLQGGSGTAYDLVTLFTAMSQAAGLDARLAMCNQRDLILFDARTTEMFMTPKPLAAVKLGGSWKFFDPGSAYLPFGRLHWGNSGTAVIIADADDAKPVRSSVEKPEDNQFHRRASLTLDENGTLEGEVVQEYAGQRNAATKQMIEDLTPDEQQKFFLGEIQKTLARAEISRLRLEHATDPEKPLKATYHLRVPEYADRTGSRLFFQPAVFQKNALTWFEAKDRKTDIIFPYPHTDTDEIHLALPTGYRLEEGSSPGALELGRLAKYETVIEHNPASNEIIYRRKFALTALTVSKSLYPAVRDAFAEIHGRDAHTLTLKRIEANSGMIPAPLPTEGSPASAEASPSGPSAGTGK